MPGADNMKDYSSKAHTGAIHSHVRPYYLHMAQSPRKLLRAETPSSWRGCVELLGSSYYNRVPLPRIPVICKLGTSSRISQRSEYQPVGPYGMYFPVAQPSTIHWASHVVQEIRWNGTICTAMIWKPRNRVVLGCARRPNRIMRITRRVTHLPPIATFLICRSGKIDKVFCYSLQIHRMGYKLSV